MGIDTVDSLVASGHPAAEIAGWIVSDGNWHFDTDPNSAVTHASSRAADADVNRLPTAKLWTAVATLLIEAAANPHVVAGAVLDDLQRKYVVVPPTAGTL
jgi:hypothetical protein